MSQYPDRWSEWLIAVLIAWGASSIIIYYGRKLKSVLGEKGLIAIERLMGLILITISIEMIMNGISEFIYSI